MQRNNLTIALICLIAGFISAYFVFSWNASNNQVDLAENHTPPTTVADKIAVINPFSTRQVDNRNEEKLSILENEISAIKQQLNKLELIIEDSSTGSESLTSRPSDITGNRFASALSQRLYNLDNLIKGGIDPVIAEDIVRRKNSIELKRLELQDRARREHYLNTERYFDELEAINQQDISLRQELGDDRYDEYLYNSKQNNRIRITSVMLGSAAEQAGIQAGDVVLSYDATRMFNWQELKDATAEGQLGEYVSISIYRNGEIFSFSVPRGPLGMQLGATRLVP